MTRRILAVPAILAMFVASALLLGVSVQTALAQGQHCGPRDRIVQLLHDKHGESRVSFGLQQNMQVMETYANSETGSWTIIVALPTGLACLVAAGEAWQAETHAPETAGDPS